MPGAISIFNQWTNRPKTEPQEFVLPDCTVPDQYMTISEIIAKFTRAGVVPPKTKPTDAGKIIGQYYPQDQGGQASFEPGFDPLDDGSEYLESFKDSHGSSEAPQEPQGEPEDGADGAGNGGA